MKALIRTAEPLRRGRLRVLVATAAALFAALLLIGSGAPAHAHTDLVGSWPPAGVADRAVHEVRLQFAEPLADGLAQVVVTGPDGPAKAGAPVVTGADVVVPLEGLTEGAYRVDYRVVSTDGHVVVGGYDLAVPAAAAKQARPEAAAAGKPASRAGRAAAATREAGAVAGTVTGARAGVATGVVAAPAAGDLPASEPVSSGATPILSDARALAVLGGSAVILVLVVGHLARRREPVLVARPRRIK